jgi:hypothetical protein
LVFLVLELVLVELVLALVALVALVALELELVALEPLLGRRPLLERGLELVVRLHQLFV